MGNSKELGEALEAQDYDREISVERPIEGSHRGYYIAQVSYKLKHILGFLGVI